MRIGLSDEQLTLVSTWFPGFEVVTDHSWGLVDTTVLHLRADSGDVVVKAAGPANHHIAREIVAHRRWTGPWLATASVNRLLHADAELNVLALSHLPGGLVLDDPHAVADPDTYRQAGALLAAFHHQHRVVSETHEAEADAKALAWLDREHRVDPATVVALRAAIATHEHQPVELVPTHGDWHPRNWLLHEGVVRVIDLGRAAPRPAWTDLARLARQEWQGAEHLERAFLAGYGEDPREPAPWRATLLREAVGTAVWAYQVGDEQFERQGHRMIRQALDLY
ncbi:aminoglycoside phosphotransferase [Actinoalloteichus sp. AHMU CJ021]|uniref:phosphotransferase family protein n=1 Tax=Actinoalloteichus sp. AHMU CJ021 TaxID=2072503 RepID=UPI000CA00276|nr:aminoglycoside phosphotransferase [Actinoalloteichus sp. AHMU CJ021]